MVFVKMDKIFHIEIHIFNVPTQMCIKTFEEKVPGKVGEYISDS